MIRGNKTNSGPSAVKYSPEEGEAHSLVCFCLCHASKSRSSETNSSSNCSSIRARHLRMSWADVRDSWENGKFTRIHWLDISCRPWVLTVIQTSITCEMSNTDTIVYVKTLSPWHIWTQILQTFSKLICMCERTSQVAPVWGQFS